MKVPKIFKVGLPVALGVLGVSALVIYSLGILGDSGDSQPSIANDSVKDTAMDRETESVADSEDIRVVKGEPFQSAFSQEYDDRVAESVVPLWVPEELPEGFTLLASRVFPMGHILEYGPEGVSPMSEGIGIGTIKLIVSGSPKDVMSESKSYDPEFTNSGSVLTDITVRGNSGQIAHTTWEDAPEGAPRTSQYAKVDMAEVYIRVEARESSADEIKKMLQSIRPWITEVEPGTVFPVIFLGRDDARLKANRAGDFPTLFPSFIPEGFVSSGFGADSVGGVVSTMRLSYHRITWSAWAEWADISEEEATIAVVQKRSDMVGGSGPEEPNSEFYVNKFRPLDDKLSETVQVGVAQGTLYTSDNLTVLTFKAGDLDIEIDGDGVPPQEVVKVAESLQPALE